MSRRWSRFKAASSLKFVCRHRFLPPSSLARTRARTLLVTASRLANQLIHPLALRQ